MRSLLLTGLIFLSIHILAQNVLNDTVYELSQVRITSSRLNNFSTGLKIQKFDSLTLDLNKDLSLAGLISTQTPIYIKSYGQGSLATISFRGTSATHTGIYWNGVRLNPPNIEVEDLSLIPSSFFNSVGILHGGSGSLFGSGNIGGSIHLRNEPDFRKDKKFNICVSAGSFQNYSASAGYEFSDGKWWSGTRLIYHNAKNNFPYTNLEDKIEKRQNAALLQYGIMQDIYRLIKNRHLFGASFWYQFTDRQIPGSLTEKQGDATQKDESVRALVKWKKFQKKGYLTAKAAFLHNDLHYFNPDTITVLMIENKIKTNTLTGEVLINHKLNGRFILNGGVNYRYDKCETIAYKEDAVRNTIGINASVLYLLPPINWKADINLRQELYNNSWVPFTPSFGAEGKIWKFVSGKINISRNFRAPTFNELYWYPLGDKNLKPETSWNEEASLIFRLDKNPDKFTSDFIITGYNSVIDNYILWLPVTADMWMPKNIQKVWARGIEIEENAKFKVQNVNCKISFAYTYSRSTNREKTGENDQSYNKQLIYVPEHSFSGQATFVFRGFVFSYLQSFTGERYVTRDYSEFLPAYNTGDLQFSKTVDIKKKNIKVQFEIHNIWDEEYQAIQNFPMPGRYFRFLINFIL